MKYFCFGIIFLMAIAVKSSHANPLGKNLGDILWQIQIPDNPGTTIQDKQIKSLKQIPDVNGDHANDVIAATGNYWTICYSGLTGNLLWQYSTHNGMINTGSVTWEDAIDIADVNNDGISDVVIGCGGGNEMVYALNGLNGNVIWSYGNPQTTNDGDIESVNIKYDFNSDGFKDVLVSASGVTTGGRHALICLNSQNGNVIFYRTQPEPYTDDVVGTESGGAIGLNNNGAPYIVRGFDSLGNTSWNYTAGGAIWSLKEMNDINNDGIKDIVGLGGFTASIFAIAGNTGAQLWAGNLGSSNNGKISLLDDADGNGFSDFSLSAPQNACRLDTKTGNIIWSTTLSSSYLRGVDNLSDVTNDGIDDIVIATQLPPRLIVLNGISGNILFDYSFGSTLNQRGDRAAVINDLDSNGVNEFLGGNREGNVICFYGGTGTITAMNNFQEIIPEGFSLSQNFPNPFNPSTTINFKIPSEGNVSLKVYNSLGKLVATLVDGKLDAGNYNYGFDATNLSSGIYYYRISVFASSLSDGQNKLNHREFVETKSMLLLK